MKNTVSFELWTLRYEMICKTIEDSQRCDEPYLYCLLEYCIYPKIIMQWYNGQSIINNGRLQAIVLNRRDNNRTPGGLMRADVAFKHNVFYMTDVNLNADNTLTMLRNS